MLSAVRDTNMLPVFYLKDPIDPKTVTGSGLKMQYDEDNNIAILTGKAPDRQLRVVVAEHQVIINPGIYRWGSGGLEWVKFDKPYRCALNLSARLRNPTGK